MLHHFHTPIADIPLPEKFTYPFCYTPHPLCVLAAKEVQDYLSHQQAWKEELKLGKMFGVLVVQTKEGETGYLAAFSGILAGKNIHPFLFRRYMIYYVRRAFSRLRKKRYPKSMCISGNWKKKRKNTKS